MPTCTVFHVRQFIVRLVFGLSILALAYPASAQTPPVQASCPTKAVCDDICRRAEEAEKAAEAAKAEVNRLAGLVAQYEKLVEQTRQSMESQLKTATGYDQLGNKNEAARVRGDADKSAQKVLELQQTLAELRDKLANARADAEAKAKAAAALRAECNACRQALAKPPCAGSEVTGAGQNAVGGTAGAVKPDKSRKPYSYTDSKGEKTVYEYDSEGLLRVYAAYDSQGKLKFREEHTYRPGGETVVRYDGQGNIEWREEISYSPDGRPTSRAMYGANGNLTSRTEYTYFPDGQEQSYVEYDGQGNVKRTVTYHYLPDGTSIRTTDSYFGDNHIREIDHLLPYTDTEYISTEIFRGGKLLYSDGLEKAAKLLGEIIEPTRNGEEKRGFNPAPPDNPEQGQPKAGDEPDSGGEIGSVPGKPGTGGLAVAVPVSLGTPSGVGNLAPPLRVTNTWQAQDNWNYVLGKHQLKAGVNWTFQRSPNNYFAIGSSPFPIANGNSFFDYSNPNNFTYFGDDWKNGQNLALNLGLTWTFYGQPANLFNSITTVKDANPSPWVWNPALQRFGLVNPVLPGVRNSFGPSVGFAYSPQWGGFLTGNGKTTVRGGYRLLYDPPFYNIYLNQSTVAPFVFLQSFSGQNNSNSAPFKPVIRSGLRWQYEQIPNITVPNFGSGNTPNILITPPRLFNGVYQTDLQLGGDTITARYLFNRGNNFNADFSGTSGYPVNLPALSQGTLNSWTPGFGLPAPDTSSLFSDPSFIQQYVLVTNQFGPEYGRNAGSVVNLLTRPGSNAWHGSLYGNENNSFLNFLGAPKPGNTLTVDLYPPQIGGAGNYGGLPLDFRANNLFKQLTIRSGYTFSQTLDNVSGLFNSFGNGSGLNSYQPWSATLTKPFYLFNGPYGGLGNPWAFSGGSATGQQFQLPAQYNTWTIPGLPNQPFDTSTFLPKTDFSTQNQNYTPGVGAPVTNGSILGTVVGRDGTIVSGATITATNTQTGSVYSTTSGATGQFQFTPFPAGNYNVTVTAQGFRTEDIKNVPVAGLSISDLGSVKMNVSGSSDTVEVTAAAPLTEPSNSQVTNTFSGTSLSTSAGIQENEGLDNLALFVPGVNSSRDNNFSNSNGAGFSVNGLRSSPGTTPFVPVPSNVFNPIAYIPATGSSVSSLVEHFVQIYITVNDDEVSVRVESTGLADPDNRDTSGPGRERNSEIFSPPADPYGGTFQLAAFHAPGHNAARASGNSADLFAQDSISGGKAGEVTYSFAAGEASSVQAMQLQVMDPSGKVNEIRMPEGMVLEPVKRTAEKPAAAAAGAAAGKVLTKQLSAYCLEFAKLPPEPGMVYRLADKALQDKFQPLRYILQAGRKLAKEGQLHPDSDPKAYLDSIRQYALWTKLENWDQQKFGEMLVSHTKEGVQKLKKMSWTKEMESALLGAVPGRWRDISRVLSEAENLKKADASAAR